MKLYLDKHHTIISQFVIPIDNGKVAAIAQWWTAGKRVQVSILHLGHTRFTFIPNLISLPQVVPSPV